MLTHGETVCIVVNKNKMHQRSKGNKMRNFTNDQNKINEYRDSVREQFKGLPFKIDSNSRGVRAECTICHDSATLEPEMWMRNHTHETAKADPTENVRNLTKEQIETEIDDIHNTPFAGRTLANRLVELRAEVNRRKMNGAW